MKPSYILVFLLLASTTYLLADNFKKRKIILHTNQQAEVEKKIRVQNCLLQSAYSNAAQLTDMTLYNDSSDTPLSLREVANRHENTLVYRFTSSNCFECVTAQLNLLKQNFSKGQDHVVIFATYPDMNGLSAIHSQNDLKFPYFNLGQTSLRLAVDSLSTPYFFVITKDLKVKNVFIPEKILPDLTTAYFKEIRSILNN